MFFSEAVRPEFIISTKTVKANNPLYKDLKIDCTSIGVELTDMGRNENDDISLQINTVPNNIQGTHES